MPGPTRSAGALPLTSYLNHPGYALIEVSSPQGVTVKRLFAGLRESGKLLRLEMDGSSLSSGVYVGRFISEGNVHTLKLVLKK